MSRRVLARPLAAVALCGALVLAAPLAAADPGQGNGQGQGQGDSHKADGKGVSQDKRKGKKGAGGGKESAPGQQKDKPQPPKDQPGNQGNAGTAQAPGQQGKKGKEPQGPKDPKPGKTNGDDNRNGNGNGNGDPAGNNGTVKIAPHGEMDGIPQNTPHPGCTFQVEWYGFDEGDDIVSTVTFAMHAPTSDVGLGVDGPTQVPVGGDPASGAGTDTGLDGRETYTLSFDGEPHPKQGYHVKLTVATPRSLGNDTKTKVFWVAPCEEEPTGETTGEPTDGATDGVADEAGDDTAATGTRAESGVLGTQLQAAAAQVQSFTGLLGSAGSSTGGTTAAGTTTAAVPTSVDAGASGPMGVLTGSPWPLLALAGGLLAASGALLVRRRAGA